MERRSAWTEAQARALLRLIRITTAHRDRDALFGAIGDALADVLPIEALAITLDGPGADQISPFVVKPAIPLPRLRRSESALGELFATGTPVLVRCRAEVAHLPGTTMVMERLNVQSYLALPLRVQDRLLGALVLHHRSPNRYDDI